jgi:ankyrin repeat protein
MDAQDLDEILNILLLGYTLNDYERSRLLGLALKNCWTALSLSLIEKMSRKLLNTPTALKGSFLHLAVCCDCLVVRALLERGADVQAVDSFRQTPLHVAIVGGQVEHAKELLSHGAHVNEQDFSGATPLLYAVAYTPEYALELMKIQGIEVDLADHRGVTPLHLAVFQGKGSLVEALLQAGANPNVLTNDGKKNPLHLALEAGRVDIAKELLTHGASVNTQDKKGNSPFHSAIVHTPEYAIELMKVPGIHVNLANKRGEKPLHLAAERGNDSLVEALLQFGANPNVFTRDDDKTPLHFALKKKQLNSARILLKHKAHVNEPDCEGFAPLHYAIFYTPEYATELLKVPGIDLNLANKSGDTPLYLAGAKRNYPLVKALLQLGVNPNGSLNSNNKTLLHFAAAQGDSLLVEALLLAGANPNARVNGNNETPLHYAIKKKRFDSARVLLAHGADINAQDAQGLTPLRYVIIVAPEYAIELLEKTEINVDLADNAGDTALHYALEEGKKEVAIKLIEAGADVDARNSAGICILDYAKDHCPELVDTILKHSRYNCLRDTSSP